jgi:hypothetical protein
MTNSSSIVVGFWRRFFADFLDAIFLGIPGYGIGSGGLTFGSSQLLSRKAHEIS